MSEQHDIALGGTDPAGIGRKVNSDEVHKILAQSAGRLNAALAQRSDEQVIDAAFLVFLARFPRAQEAAAALAHIRKSEKRDRALTDLLWALANTREFLLGS